MNEVSLLTLTKVWIYSCNQQFIITSFLCVFLCVVAIILSFPLFDCNFSKQKTIQLLIKLTLITITLFIIISVNYYSAIEIANEKQISNSVEITNKIEDMNIIQECKNNIITYNNNILFLGISNYINCIEEKIYTIKFRQTKNHLESLINN